MVNAQLALKFAHFMVAAALNKQTTTVTNYYRQLYSIIILLLTNFSSLSEAQGSSSGELSCFVNDLKRSKLKLNAVNNLKKNRHKKVF